MLVEAILLAVLIGLYFFVESPQITKVEPGNVASVSTGGTVVLKCFAQGEPTPSVYWQFSADGKGKMNNRGIYISADLGYGGGSVAEWLRRRT